MDAVRVSVGTSGFSYKEWKGSFYPEDLPAREMLRYYSGRLPAVEINNTFYRMPRASVLENWVEQVGDPFRFVLKASRRITHFKRLNDVSDETDYLFSIAAALGDHLGAILFQLPPNLKKDLPLLSGFLPLVPKGFRAAMEFRHDSWFDEEVLAALREHDVALCAAETDEKAAPETVSTVGVRTAPPLRVRRRRAGLLGSEDRLAGLGGGFRLLQARGCGSGAGAGRTLSGADGRGLSGVGPAAFSSCLQPSGCARRQTPRSRVSWTYDTDSEEDDDASGALAISHPAPARSVPAASRHRRAGSGCREVVRGILR
jgi:uncharacterized protein YecE (DUF72 family)